MDTHNDEHDDDEEISWSKKDIRTNTLLGV